MHDDFFDHPRPLIDHRLFRFLRHLNDVLPSSGEICLRRWAVDRATFDGHLLLAQAYRFLHRLLGDPAVDAYVPALDFPFADGEVFFHHRDRDLLSTFDAPWARSPVRHMGRGRRPRRCWSGAGVGSSARPALLPPLRRPRVDIDRVQPLQNRHASLSLVIATLNHHECTASADSLIIGVRLLMRHTEVDECIKKGIALRGGVPRDGCVRGLATLGVVKSQMHIAPGKAVLQ
jgi:hypothetical protein